MKKYLLTIIGSMVLMFSHAQNVGIGTGTPLMKLHVSAPDSAILLLENTQSSTAGNKSAMYFKTGTRYTGAIKTEHTSATDARLGFFTFAGTDANTLRERLSIDDNGYIGIGTITPATQMHIRQSTSPGFPSLLLEESFDTTVKLNMKTTHANNGSNNYWTVAAYNNNTAANERFSIINNATGTLMSLTGIGRFGIGTNSPLMKLHVNAADSAVALLSNSQSPAAGIKTSMYFQSGNRYGGAIKTEYTSATDARLGFFTFAGTDANTLRERMSIDDNGYVGVGVSAPTTLVHIKQGTLAGLPTLLLEENFDNFARLNFKNINNANYWTIAGYNNNTLASERLNFYNNVSGNLMSLTGKGALGIGTTGPSAMLEVVNSNIPNAIGVTAIFSNTTGNSSNVVEITNATGAFGSGLFSHINGPGGGGAVYGKNDGNGANGIVGEASNGTSAWGIVGISTTGEAGHFAGNVNVVGTLSKSAGTFRIDHPVDPANKYLIHSFVESPDMMNVYNGNIKTDAGGKAIVDLPSYFEAENINFKYQLTIVDETKFAMARVSKKIAGNKFEIMTDQPNIEVSWQVTGVRNDAYAVAHRIVPEVEKTGKEVGKYIHPELFGATDKQSVYYKEPKPADKTSEATAPDPSAKLSPSNNQVQTLPKKTD